MKSLEIQLKEDEVKFLSEFKIKARRGEKVAIVATARHMAESVYWVLTRKEYYKENKAIRASSFS